MTDSRFTYRARRMNGQVVDGELMARDMADANLQVSQLGLIPVSVKSGSIPTLKNIKDFEALVLAYRGVPVDDLMIFTQQLQTVYAVGVPLVQGLTLIADQTDHALLKKAVRDLISHVSGGGALSESMAKHPTVFNNVYISMIKVGEASGHLEEILSRLHEVIEAQARNRMRVKSALFYPKIVMGAIFVVFTVLVIYVIPKMRTFYDSMGAGDLPLPTRIVLMISDFVRGNILWLGLLVGGGYYGFQVWVKTPKGGLMWDRFKLKLPMFGMLIIEIEMNTFCVIMRMLIASGLGIVQCFEVLKGTLSNRVVQNDIDECRKHVSSGGRIGDALMKSESFPRMFAGLLGIGEETGSIDKVLDKSANYYQTRVEHKLSNLSKAIEPAMLVVVFGFVLLLALAIFLPIWQLAQKMKR